MNRKWCYLYLLLSFQFSPVAYSQFINLQITVEPELSTTVDQVLDFGTMITNSGEKYIGLDDINKGIFNIRAFKTQSVFVDLVHPEYLISLRPNNDSRVPINLEMAYQISRNDPYSAIPLPDKQGLLYFTNPDQPNISSGSDIWEDIFIYIYGSIEVGNVPNGEYFGDVSLVIDYY